MDRVRLSFASKYSAVQWVLIRHIQAHPVLVSQAEPGTFSFLAFLLPVHFCCSALRALDVAISASVIAVFLAWTDTVCSFC